MGVRLQPGQGTRLRQIRHLIHTVSDTGPPGNLPYPLAKASLMIDQ
jgi:hypothetical protein